MRKTLFLVLVGLLLVPSALCTTSLLKLERSESPAGPWEEVAAETLPITAEGAFQDTYASSTGFYRMQIEPGGEWGFPLNIPLEEIPRMPVDIAQSLLDDLPIMDDDNSWEGAELGPIGFPVYTPTVDGPAYMEFAVLGPQPEPPDLPFGALQDHPPVYNSYCGSRRRGSILVSLTENDPPILQFATEGDTQTECLRKMANSSAVRIVRYGDGFLAAENEKGQLVAYAGAPPVYYPDKILELAGKEFEGYVDPQGGNQPEDPNIQGEPYKDYDAFRKDWLESQRFREARSLQREEAKLDWEIYRGQHEEVINLIVCQETLIFEDRVVEDFKLGDSTIASFQIQRLGVLIHAKKAGVTTLSVVFGDGEKAEGFLVASEKALSSEQPTGWTSWTYYWAGNWSQQRRYTQEWGGSCWSGCGATAWAMLYGWFDYTGAATNLISGSAPLYNNNAVRDCIWYVVDRIDTYCAGSSGATNPWDMPDGWRWAQYRGCGYSVSWVWSVPCFYSSSARNKAADSIKNDHRPTIIGIGCTGAHYPVAYGYAYRKYKIWGVTLKTSRYFKCNMGWGGSSPQWKKANVWYGQRNNFW